MYDQFAEGTRSAAASVAENTRGAAASFAEGARDTRDRVMSAASDASDRVRSAAGDAADATREKLGAARETLDAARERFGDVRDRTASAIGSATGYTRDAAASVRDSAVQAGRYVADRGQSFAELCREQPLVLAGLGLAIGAVIGALLPPSDTEDRLMGEASDDTKDAARRLAGQAKEGAQAVYDEAKAAAMDAAAESGLRGESLGGRTRSHEETPARSEAGGISADGTPRQASDAARSESERTARQTPEPQAASTDLGRIAEPPREARPDTGTAGFSHASSPSTPAANEARTK
jgi:hypothetical protein